MNPLSDFRRPYLNNDIAYTVATYLSPESIAKCIRVSREWKQVFNFTPIWDRCMRIDYPHIEVMKGDIPKNLYFRLRRCSKILEACSWNVTKKSKMAPSVVFNSDNDALSPSYYVHTSQKKVAVYTTNNSARSYELETTLYVELPKILLNKYLLLSEYKVGYELWDLDTKELIEQKPYPTSLQYIQKEGDYLYCPSKNTLQFISLKKDAPHRPPLILNETDLIECAYVCRDQWYLFDTNYCFITTLEGSLTKKIPIKVTHPIKNVSDVNFVEMDNFYLFNSKLQEYFQIIYKSDLKEISIPKSYYSSCIFHDDRLIFFRNNKISYYRLDDMAEGNINPEMPQILFDFGSKMVSMLGEAGNKIILRAKDHFIIFDLYMHTFTTIGCMASINYDYQLIDNFICFVSYLQGHYGSSILLVDVRTGNQLRNIQFPGLYCGMNDKNELVFKSQENISLVFTTYSLHALVQENLDNIESCFEIIKRS